MVKGILVNRKSDDALKSQLKMEHADLVAEMQTVENLPTHERLQLARLRRAQQLKVARQKEKEWLKLQRAKGNPVPFVSGSGVIGGSNTTHHFRHNGSNGSAGGGGGGSGPGSGRARHISFENSVVLLEAASRNDMHEVAELLERGITADAANEDGLTALHQCCIDNNVEMLKLLLEYGASVDAQDSDKWTPLHAAATCGHLELVRILIDHGANLLAVNTDGNMPYDLCDDENTLDFIEAEMSKRGVTQELIDETRSSTEREMLKDLMDVGRNGGDLEEPDYQGATPLHIAAANGYVRVVEFLLEMHVNVDAMDKDMWTPVHAAACWGHLEVLEMLAQCGADLNVKNKDDETPSDICEDPEIRERIEQLKTEQESKRLAEAQRRRVRRSQSNNTRAQSVRRTSLRDKTLTTKKDAVEEARLRLQAQEVFTTTPAAATCDSNGLDDSSNTSTATTGTSKENGNQANHWMSNGPTNNHNNNNNNNTMHTNNNNNDKKSTSYQASLAANASASGCLLPHSMSADAVDATSGGMLHSYLPRRPPDGRENDEYQMSLYKSSEGEKQQHQRSTSVGVSERPSSEQPLQAQTTKEAANGKINVQVTVLVDTTSTHHHHHQQHQQHQQNQQQQLQQLHPQHLMHSQLMEGSSYSAATLANLKKQRSLSRSNVLNCENGSVLGAAANTTSTTTTANSSGSSTNNPTTANNNNNNSIQLGTDSHHPPHHGNHLSSAAVSSQPISGTLHPALLDFGSATSVDSAAYATVNKFSGVTGDVVSDSTSSKKCCVVM